MMGRRTKSQIFNIKTSISVNVRTKEQPQVPRN